ncbi:MAG: hypothetical protein RMY34_06060 [Aulosira sp. DedQUE10]|nr:hypothetical protein [Aulosira sp. DedQUE10]
MTRNVSHLETYYVVQNGRSNYLILNEKQMTGRIFYCFKGTHHQCLKMVSMTEQGRELKEINSHLSRGVVTNKTPHAEAAAMYSRMALQRRNRIDALRSKQVNGSITEEERREMITEMKKFFQEGTIALNKIALSQEFKEGIY